MVKKIRTFQYNNVLCRSDKWNLTIKVISRHLYGDRWEKGITIVLSYGAALVGVTLDNGIPRREARCGTLEFPSSL